MGKSGLGVQAWLLTGHSAPSSLIRVATVAGTHHAKQCWPFCSPGVTPSPEGRCEEPSPLIRTGRLGPRPPQAQTDFSGCKTCKIFLCALQGCSLQDLGGESLPLTVSRPGRCGCSYGADWRTSSPVLGPGMLWALRRGC